MIRLRLFQFLLLLASLASSSAFSSVTMSATGEVTTPTKHQLFDMPVSNNGARCRIILYKKAIPETEVAIVPPVTLGGLKDPKYLAMNPQGKMPTLRTADGFSIPESDTIARFLLSEYAHIGPSFLPNNARSNLIARLHDMYLTTIQGCMYKATPPFGIYRTRKEALTEFRKQLKIIDDCVQEGAPYLCGEEVSLADATLFPTMVFAKYMLPKFDVPEKEALPPRIAAWFANVIASDVHFKKVYDEVQGSLEKWDANGRWDTIWLAGLRDTDPGTIFDKIVAKEIPATVVRETSDVLAFKDINPAAPEHILIIPKERAGLTRLSKSSVEHVEVLGKMMVMAGELVRDESLGFDDGARIIVNDGPDGGQEVYHLHVHVVGGRPMAWPPG